MPRRVICIIFVCIIVLNSTGCQSNRYQKNFAVAVIETSSDKKDSTLKYYNTELELVYSQNMMYTSLGNIFYPPMEFDERIYLVPQGDSQKKDEKKILEIDLDNNQKNVYDIDALAINSVCANEEYIFACNTLNGISYINACDKKSKEVKTIKFPEIFISKVICKNKLYAFGIEKKDDLIYSYLYIMNGKSLEVEKQIDLSSYGGVHYSASFIDDLLYFPNPRDQFDNAGTSISCFDTKTNEIDNIDLGIEYPQDIVPYEDYLIVSHFDLVTGIGDKVTFYNTKTKESSHVTLGYSIYQMILKNDALYILDENSVYKYNIENCKLHLIQKIKVKSGKNTYLSGIF